METVAEIVDACFRQYLEPPDFQPPMALLGTGVGLVDTTVTLATFALPEDEQLLRVGVVLEVGSELMRVTAYDPLTLAATVDRGALGTLSGVHAQGAAVKISPPYPRLDVFREVASGIATLSPPLFTVKVEQVIAPSPGVAPLPDPLAVSIIDITRQNRHERAIGSHQLVDHHPQTGTRSVLFPVEIGESLWVRYRRRLRAPDEESDSLEGCGLEPMWVPAVVAGAAGAMMVGRDVPRSSAEWVGQILESTGIKYGTRQTVGFGLVQYRDVLIQTYRREMTQEYKSVTSVRRSPFYTTEHGPL